MPDSPPFGVSEGFRNPRRVSPAAVNVLPFLLAGFEVRHAVSCSFRALSFRAGFFLLIGMTGATGSSFSSAPTEMVKGKRYRSPPMMAVIVAGSSGGVGNAITGFFLVVILALVMFTSRLGGFSMTAGFFFIRAPALIPPRIRESCGS